MTGILVKQNERLRSFQQHDQWCGGLSISLEADQDEGLESQVSTGWFSWSEFFLSWGENAIQPTSRSFSTQGADGTAWQPHRIKTRDCFSAVPSTNFFPRSCDFCKSTSLVLCVVFSYSSPDWWTICSCQILQSPKFLPAEIEWGVKRFRSGFDDPSCGIEHVDSFHSWQRADYLCFLDILSCFLRIFFTIMDDFACIFTSFFLSHDKLGLNNKQLLRSVIFCNDLHRVVPINYGGSYQILWINKYSIFGVVLRNVLWIVSVGGNGAIP